MYEFDRLFEQDKLSVKWSDSYKGGRYESVIPMWVADMDFAVASEIQEALAERLKTPVYGYTYYPENYHSGIIEWLEERHQISIQKEWIVSDTSVMAPVRKAIQAFSNAGDGVLIQTPVYPPFAKSILDNNRKVLRNSFLNEGESIKIDFADFEEKLKSAKIFILCNPQNPIGKVYSREELDTICQLCKKHDVLILSDEIHADLIYSDQKHHSMIEWADQYDKIICIMAPSKTFNVAGLCSAFAFIADETVRTKLVTQIENCGGGEVNIFGKLATVAAYNHGAGWHKATMEYIEKNRDFALEYIQKQIPQIEVRKPEGTYFLWLNCTKLGLAAEELNQFFLNQAGLQLNPGIGFGEEGAYFMRMNIACRRALLEEALGKLKRAIANCANKE